MYYFDGVSIRALTGRLAPPLVVPHWQFSGLDSVLLPIRVP